MRVLICDAEGNNACAFYRGWEVWSQLAASSEHDISLHRHTNPSRAELKVTDLVFMLRPVSDGLQRVAYEALGEGVPVWVDYDDNLFELTPENPSHSFYSQQGVQKNIDWFLKECTLTSLSTPQLAKYWGEKTKRAVVIPNAFNESLLEFAFESPVPNKLVVWRGSPTHVRDVCSVSNQLVNVARDFPGFTFAFLGGDPCPWEIGEKMKNAATFPAMDVWTYHQVLATLKPSILISPLADNKFNRCKSNIAAMEAAFAGAVCLAPDFEEWRMPGVNVYESPKLFGSDLRRLLNDLPGLSKQADETRKHITEHLRLGIVNKEREKLLVELVNA